jgi:hypothetical protein
VNISGLGLPDAGMEIWVGMTLLAVLGFLLGFAINYGSICTVIATSGPNPRRLADFAASLHLVEP